MAKTQMPATKLCIDCANVLPGVMIHIGGEDHGCAAAEANGVDPVNGGAMALGCRAMRTWGPCGIEGRLWKAAKE